MAKVESITKNLTKIRLIDREELSRLTRHGFPLSDIEYIDFCAVKLSLGEAAVKLTEAGYSHVMAVGDVVYVGVNSHPEQDRYTCEMIAREIFGVEPLITHVHRASSQAGIASFAH